MGNLLHADITDKAWRAYYNTCNAHGRNYPEDFYERIMELEFRRMGVHCERQVEYLVYYRDRPVGKHFLDTELEDTVVLEYKVAPAILPRHEAQLISNLRISAKPVGLLLNFGGLKAEGVRRVLTRQHKRPKAVWQPGPSDPQLLYPDLTLDIRQGLWEIYRNVGPGFLHRIYCNATRIELRMRGISAEGVRKLDILHHGERIGDITFRHFIVDDRVVLAPVTVSEIGQSEVNKVRMIMRRRQLQLGMIANFQAEVLQVKYVRI